MIEVNTGTTNSIEFISRYNQIDKWEIMDHNSRIVYSGDTTEVGYEGRIILTGFTFTFDKNEVYSFKAYYKNTLDNKYYLCTQQLLKTWVDDNRIDNYIKQKKSKNTYKVYGK